MNKILLLLICLISLSSICFAETKEIIAEGTYTIENGDTITAKDKALLIAKRNAIEQSGTYITSSTNMKNFILVDDQVKSMSSGIIRVKILDEKKITIDGQPTYYVKIKATVTPDELNKYLSQQSNEPKTIELIDLIALFAKDKIDNIPITRWDAGTENKAIEWDTDGVSWGEGLKGERIGHAVITINGQYLADLRKTVEPLKWEIYLKGKYSDHGVPRIITGINRSPAKIHRDYNPQELWTFEKYLNSISIPYKVVYELGKVDYGSKIYEINFSDKNTVWVTYSWSFGASGAFGGFGIHIHYSLDKALNDEDLKYREATFNSFKK